jgi:anthranilate phosphoribosyltransferase
VFHSSLRHAGVPRRELGIPTTFNFLGPLTNPARPAAQAVGVADPRMAPVMAGVLARRGVEALVMHGDDGLDELTTTTTSTVWLTRPGGDVERHTVDPTRWGIAAAAPEDLRGGDPQHNAEVFRRVLAGDRSPVRDAVLLNAAAGLAVHTGGEGVLDDRLTVGLEAAAQSVDIGAAADVLQRWVAATAR